MFKPYSKDKPMPFPVDQRRADAFLSGNGGTVNGGDR
jgi:hypothetical protein